MKTINLTQGKEAIVDDEDFEYLNEWKWFFDGRYAARNVVGGPIRMHRVINKTPAGMDTDHINGDKLDNRKSNLRSCTTSENGMNSKKRKDNTAGLKGVRFKKDHKKWQSRIVISGKEKFLGYFSTPEEAAKAYDNAATEFFGEFARTNFGEV